MIGNACERTPEERALGDERFQRMVETIPGTTPAARAAGRAKPAGGRGLISHVPFFPMPTDDRACSAQGME
jgi:hypothetical protein